VNEVYRTFIEKFNVPENLRNHLQIIFNREEAILLNYLNDKEENIPNLINKFPELTPKLIESLYKKGYLIRKLEKGTFYYMSNTFDQILKRFVNHDLKFQKLSSEIKAKFQEYIMEIYLQKMKDSKKPVYRVIPIEKTIPDKRQLIPYYQAIHYLKKASILALIDCICRTTHQKCEKPRRVCLALGDQAKFFIEREIGEEINVEKGLEILNIAEENGLVHSIDNKEEPSFLCNCCECCCVFVQGLKKYGIFTSIGKSGFIAIQNSESCDDCGICVEKCIFEAISYTEGKIQFNENKCFGCGHCAYHCPQNAIKLIQKK